MSEKRLYLIRHGHTTWNGPPLRFQGQMDSSLSENGRAEAIALGERMPYQPHRVISSPSLRCRQTVDCLFNRKPDQTERRCIELGLGWFEGHLASEHTCCHTAHALMRPSHIVKHVAKNTGSRW